MLTSRRSICGPGTLARNRSDAPSSGWMRRTRRLGCTVSTAVDGEGQVRRRLELDRHLGRPAGKALAGAQVEGRARPAPVVDRDAQGHEGLGVGLRIDARPPRGSRAPARPRSTPGRTGRAPRPPSLGVLEGRDGAQDLHLLVADLAALEARRRLHGHDREHLEHVVLHDVAQRAALGRSSRRGCPTPRSSATVIWMWSTYRRFQIGSKMALPKRSTSRFWTVSFPR